MSPDRVTTAAVFDALRELARGDAPEDSPLQELHLVRRSLGEAGFEPTERARRHEVGRLLLEVTEEELVRLRRLVGAAALDGRSGAGGSAALIDATRGTARELRDTILSDYAHGHRDLESISAIYHLYLRPDLGLTLEDFVALLGDRHKRTVQRRLRRGVVRTTERLRAMERDAVLEVRRERLLAAIPTEREAPLFGVDEMLSVLGEFLRRDGGPVLLLGGPPGIGKSALARAAVAEEARSGRLRALTWLSMPGTRRVAESSPQVDRAWRAGSLGRGDEVVPEAVLGTLRRRLAQTPGWRGGPSLAVVDGVDDPAIARSLCEELYGSTDTVLLVGRGVEAAAGSGRWLVRQGPLPREAAKAFLVHEAERRGLDPSATEVEAVVAATAGHPAALRLAAVLLRVREAHEVAADFTWGRGQAGVLYDALWAASWQDAPASAQAATRAVIALRRAGVVARPSNLRTALGADVLDATAALEAALDAGLIIAGTADHALATPVFLRRWLATKEGQGENSLLYGAAELAAKRKAAVSAKEERAEGVREEAAVMSWRASDSIAR